MPEVLTREEFEFLSEVDRLAREGVPFNEIARRKGVAPGTISYRMNRRALASSSTACVIDRRSGKTLQEMVDSGEFVIADAREGEKVPA